MGIHVALVNDAEVRALRMVADMALSLLKSADLDGHDLVPIGGDCLREALSRLADAQREPVQDYAEIMDTVRRYAYLAGGMARSVSESTDDIRFVHDCRSMTRQNLARMPQKGDRR